PRSRTRTGAGCTRALSVTSAIARCIASAERDGRADWPLRTYAGSCWKGQAGQRIIGCVAETIEALERRIDELRVAVREAVLAGDPALASARRAELKRAEQAWEDALTAA